MKPSKLMMALLAAAGLCLAGGGQAQTMNKDQRDMAVKSAEAQYKQDKAACASLSGNSKDICVEEAKGREKVAKADADAAYLSTPKARENARDARAEAAYEVAKERCDDVAGNNRDVCMKEARAAYVKSEADAKVDRVAADARKDSAQKTAEARREAASDKREADYKVAVEKCDALAGAAKDTCVRDAKVKYGKS
jgi:hypothetical protein